MAQCPRHPEQTATDLCVGCGEWVCGQCGYVTEDRRVFCPSCRPKVDARPKPAAKPPRSTPWPPPPAQSSNPPEARPGPAREGASTTSPALIVALVMPFLCFCPVSTLFGLLLAYNELKRIREGKSSASHGLGMAAVWLNGLALAGQVLWFLISAASK